VKIRRRGKVAQNQSLLAVGKRKGSSARGGEKLSRNPDNGFWIWVGGGWWGGGLLDAVFWEYWKVRAERY